MTDLLNENLWLYLMFAASEIAAVWIAIRIWRSDEHRFFKIAFSVLAFIPLLGPLFVLSFFNMPPPNHPAQKDYQRREADVYDRWRHVLEEKDPQEQMRLTGELLERWQAPQDSQPPPKRRKAKRKHSRKRK
jgi:hypothetical protein